MAKKPKRVTRPVMAAQNKKAARDFLRMMPLAGPASRVSDRIIVIPQQPQRSKQVAKPVKRRRTAVQKITRSIRRVGKARRKGPPKLGGAYMSLKKVFIRKGANALGAAVDVGFDVASAALARSTENTFDDALANAASSTAAKIGVGIAIDWLLGSKAQHITGGMTGSSVGKWMRSKLAAPAT